MQFIACWSLPTPFSTALPSTGNEASAPMCSLTSSMWCLRTSKAVCSSTPHGVSSVSAAHIPPPSLRTWSTCWTPCRPTPSQGVPWFQERGLWQDNSYEPRLATLSFSIGMMAARMVLPTMLVSWRRWRMAASTLSRVTLAIAAVKTVTRLVTMKSMGTEPRRIN